MADSMIERMARIIDPIAWASDEMCLVSAMRAESLVTARAVLTVMREPTERIVTAIQPFCKSDDFDTDQSAAIDAWQSAIDAVLAEA